MTAIKQFHKPSFREQKKPFTLRSKPPHHEARDSREPASTNQIL